MNNKNLLKAQTIIDTLFYDEKALTQWQHRLLEDVIGLASLKLRKLGVSGKQLTYCQCEVPTGRTVTADFENQICDSCGRLVACAKTKRGKSR